MLLGFGAGSGDPILVNLFLLRTKSLRVTIIDIVYIWNPSPLPSLQLPGQKRQKTSKVALTAISFSHNEYTNHITINIPLMISTLILQTLT